MGDETEKRRREMHNLSIQTENYPSDLLQRFSDEQKPQSEQEQQDNEEIELNLGLSLGGRFGVDKNKKLIRSSSIAGPIPILRDKELITTEPSPVPYTTLIRASSLPTETEEVWRKRKEMQSLRRMEAKQRRSKKLRNLRTDRIDLNRDEDDKSKDKVRMQLGRTFLGWRAEVGGGGCGGGGFM